MEQHEDRHESEIFQKNQEGLEHRNIDIDVNSEGNYGDDGPVYPPRKNADIKRIVLGIFVAAAIICLTWYAFNANPIVEAPGSAEDQTAETNVPGTLDQAQPIEGRTADEGPTEKALDGMAFSPTPETLAAAEADARDAETRAAARKTAETTETKIETAAGEIEPAKLQAAEVAPATAKRVETKPAAAKAAETKPAEPKAAEVKPAGTKPAATKAAEATPAETKPAEAGSAEVTASVDDDAAKPETATAETVAPAALVISDKWAVNISSTPDSNESHKLLMRILGHDLGGRIYSYETLIDGKQHYRIRVGFFTTRAEAEAIGQKIFDDFKLSSRPWAVQPIVDEVDRYSK